MTEPLGDKSPRLKEEVWQPFATAPLDGTTIIVRLTSGAEIEAQYWCGPDERPDWGGWAWNGLPFFLADVPDPGWEAEWVAWRPAQPEEITSKCSDDNAFPL